MFPNFFSADMAQSKEVINEKIRALKQEHDDNEMVATNLRNQHSIYQQEIERLEYKYIANKEQINEIENYNKIQ